jgi:hypothetical protein
MSVAKISNSSLGNSRLHQFERVWPAGQRAPRIEWFLGWCRIRRDLP